MKDIQEVERAGFNDQLDMGNRAEKNSEVWDLLGWKNADATKETNQYKMTRRFQEKSSE